MKRHDDARPDLGLPNARAADEKTVAEGRCLEPLKARKEQLPCDVGLFSDNAERERKEWRRIIDLGVVLAAEEMRVKRELARGTPVSEIARRLEPIRISGAAGPREKRGPRLVVDNTKRIKVLSTGKIDGGAYRWIKLADGSSRIEEWKGGKWVPGGADIDEMWYSPPISRKFAVRLGIPSSDLWVEP